MPSVGACAVVLTPANEVLLTKREDFEVWCLPGGAVDPGESLAQAAVREVREETGLEVRLTGLVGLYSRPTRDNHVAVFAAVPTGGALAPSPTEAIDAGFFPTAKLPEPMLWWHRPMVEHAAAGVRGGVWTMDAPWPFPPEVQTRADLYAFRDRTGLSRAEFYQRYLVDPGPTGIQREC